MYAVVYIIVIIFSTVFFLIYFMSSFSGGGSVFIVFDRLVLLFSDCFLEIKWVKKGLASISFLKTASFLMKYQCSLNESLFGEGGSLKLKDACCSEFLNVQLIEFVVKNRPEE